MSESFATLHPHAAGIDLGSRMIWVSVSSTEPVRSFGSTTPDLERLVAYLHQHQVTTVAMEATGVLWMPLYQMLEQQKIEICLVNGAHARNVPGRKSDVSDCQWLRQLHEHGLVRASFVPPQTICALREYMRLRQDHIQISSQHVQHMQRALEMMNLKLHTVIEQVHGQSGLRVLEAIIDGQRDAEKLLELCDTRIRNNKASEFRAALTGNYRAEHIFALKQAVECWRYYQQKVAECDQQIEALLREITAELPPPDPEQIGQAKPGRHHRFGGDADDLHRMVVTLSGGVNLALLPGFSDLRLLELLSEVGTDMSKWKTEKHFTAWLNLAPSMHRSGRQSKRRRRSGGAPRAGQLFRMAAQSLANSTKPALGGFYRQLKSRSMPAVALKATARKLATLFYRMLRYGQSYVEVGIEQFERNYHDQQQKSLQRRAAKLGFQLVPATA